MEEDYKRYIIELVDIPNARRYIRLSVGYGRIKINVRPIGSATKFPYHLLQLPELLNFLKGKSYQVIELPGKYYNKILNQ